MFTKASVLVAGLTATAAAETIHSVLVFTRHGDRTAKYFNNAVLTNVGATECYQAGSFYRSRYIAAGSETQIKGISSDVAVPSQLYATAPDSGVLSQSALSFLQGLYPPLDSLNAGLAVETLANGTNTTDPLNGYQFVLLNGIDSNSPNNIWIQGDTNCPAYTSASASYSKSAQYQQLINSTADIYAQFDSILNPILGAGNVTYKNAYNVFDLLNVAKIHNTSIAANISDSGLQQVQYLADTHEFNANYNATQMVRAVGGQTFAGGLLQQLNASVATKAAKQKFTLMAGSYDVFQGFFGMTNLTAASNDFYGIPQYAANMVFELFTTGTNDTFPNNTSDDLMVRFGFRNGSDADLNMFPLFGGNETEITYGSFVSELSSRAVNNLTQWCGYCGSTADICVAANATKASSGSASGSSAGASSSTSGSHLSNAAAGGIGAGVTLAVVAVLAGLAALVFRKRGNKASRGPVTANSSDAGSATGGHVEKTASGSDRESV